MITSSDGIAAADNASVPTSPLQHYQRRLKGGELRADDDQLAALLQLNELFEALVSDNPKPGLVARLLGRQWVQHRGIYLWGGVGTGKTLLMDLFHHALPEAAGRRIHFHRFMQWVHEEKNRIRKQQDPLAVIAAQLATRHRVLCLDEFSVTDITDAMILSGLLHRLFENNVALVTTSNAHPDDLYRDGLQRRRFLPAIDLLKAQTRLIKVDGGRDYRMSYLTSEALYHTPHNDRAVRALRRNFAALEGVADAGGQPKTTVRLCGREVEVIAVGRGAVWFSFDALCRGKRSKLDYIELSKRFHSILLSDIPALDADQDDEARRFIELVDELYDRGVNLMASAARPPEQLYDGKRLRQPFQRTASRLREMGSAAYLARAHLP